MLKKAVISVLVLAIAAAALVGGGFVWVEDQYEKPGPLAVSVTVVIQPGDSLRTIASDLASAGVIHNADVFFWKTRFDGTGSGLKAGEYAFEPAITPRDIIRKLTDHDVVRRFVTVPEGLTSIEIFELISIADNLTGDLTDVPPEGSLMPETYSVTLGDTRQGFINRMTQAAEQAKADLWAKRAPDLPFDTWEEAVILASIVEKETGVAAERGKVAGVFVNRLRIGMRLQTDPTVIYGITNGSGPLGRKLRRSDLDTDTPYNSYTRAGLPPGPICNPGRAALEAVLNPVETDAFYFVADGTGGHAFAKTLAEHNRNVAKWRKLQKQQSQN